MNGVLEKACTPWSDAGTSFESCFVLLKNKIRRFPRNVSFQETVILCFRESIIPETVSVGPCDQGAFVCVRS